MCYRRVFSQHSVSPNTFELNFGAPYWHHAEWRLRELTILILSVQEHANVKSQLRPATKPNAETKKKQRSGVSRCNLPASLQSTMPGRRNAQHTHSYSKIQNIKLQYPQAIRSQCGNAAASTLRQLTQEVDTAERPLVASHTAGRFACAAAAASASVIGAAAAPAVAGCALMLLLVLPLLLLMLRLRRIGLKKRYPPAHERIPQWS